VGDSLSSGPGGDAAKEIVDFRTRATKKDKASFSRYIHDRAFELLDELNSVLKTEKIPESAAPLIARKLRLATMDNMVWVRKKVVEEMEFREKQAKWTVERDQKRPPKEGEPSTVAKLLYEAHLGVDFARARVEYVADLAGFRRRDDRDVPIQNRDVDARS
jgi:hypothetical protein